MDVVFLGVNDVGMRIYEWLCDREGVHVAALVTTTDQLELIERLRPDLVVSVGYGHLVPPDVLSIPPEGCINLHPSYLPHNRGKSPNVWSIVEGTPAGVTLHYMDEEFDTGEIIERREMEVGFDATGKDLHERLERAQFDLFTDVWPRIEGGDVETTPQSADEGRYHSVADFRDLCEIDPEATYEAKELLDVLRALTFPPFDNAYLELDGERYYVDVEIRAESESGDDDPDAFLSSY
jgi:methionyl-tRNA formyltransferase